MEEKPKPCFDDALEDFRARAAVKAERDKLSPELARQLEERIRNLGKEDSDAETHR